MTDLGEGDKRGKKIPGNSGEKQAALNSGDFMQWAAVSQKPEGQSRCVPSEEKKSNRESSGSQLARPAQAATLPQLPCPKA